MKIIGCDFHPGYQQIAMLDKNTGEVTEKRLTHSNEGEEAKKFYSELTGPVLVGLEASGQSQWFERCLAELGHELWIGDAAKIRDETFLADASYLCVRRSGMKSCALLVFVFVLLLLTVVAGCAPGANQFAGTAGEHGVAGFWLGLWQGLIAPVALVVSLFKSNVNIYEVHNNGAWYNFGYVFGLACFFGGGGGGAARRK